MRGLVGTKFDSVKELLDFDAVEAMSDTELDDELWLLLIPILSSPDLVAGLPAPVRHYVASRWLEWEVGNGGFAGAALNIPEWFAMGAEGYAALGKFQSAALIREAAIQLSELDGDPRGGKREAERALESLDARIVDEEWYVTEERIAYVRRNAEAFRVPDFAAPAPAPEGTVVEETPSQLLIATRYKANASTWPIIAGTLLATAISAGSLLRNPSAIQAPELATPGFFVATWSAMAFVGFGLVAIYLLAAALTGREVMRLTRDRMRVGAALLGLGPRGSFALDRIESVQAGTPGSVLASTVFDGNHVVFIETDRLRVMFGRKSGWNATQAEWVAKRMRTKIESLRQADQPVPPEN